MLPFINIRREFSRADVHFLDEIFRNYIHHKLSRFLDVAKRVLPLPVAAANHRREHTTGGFALAAVKKLNGARLRTPERLIVDTNAIGRGTIAPTINL